MTEFINKSTTVPVSVINSSNRHSAPRKHRSAVAWVVLWLSLILTGTSHAAEDSISYAFNIAGVGPTPGTTQGLQLYRHELGDFAGATLIREYPYPNNRVPFFLEWNQDMTVLYGLRESDYDLVALDIETGEMVDIAPLTGLREGDVPVGLAIDQNNRCFVTASATVPPLLSSRHTLYQCNFNTGELTYIGEDFLAGVISGTAADCDGNLYALQLNGGGSVWKISTADASIEVFTSFDIGLQFLQSITYDRYANQLYGYLYQGTVGDENLNKYVRIDPQTGEFTILSDTDPYGEFIGAARTTCRDTAVTPGFAGAWFNPETPGQGILLDVLSNSDQLFMAWFTHEVAGAATTEAATVGDDNHRWLTAQGTLGTDLSVTLDLFVTAGGEFVTSTDVQTTRVGEATLSFTSCTAGTLAYTLDDSGLTGSFPISRLAGDGIALCETLLDASAAR